MLRFTNSRVGWVKINNSAADDGGNSRTSHGSSVEGSISALRSRTRHIKNPFKLRVEDGDVTMSILRQTTPIMQTEYARWICSAHFHYSFETNKSSLH